MSDPASGKRLRQAALLSALIALADQATKAWILLVVMQPPRVIPVFPGFNLTLTYNRGVSFGLFGAAESEWQPYLLSVMAVLVVALLGFWLWREGERWKTPAIGLIAGGALGNVVDRLIRPGVVDFLDVYVGDWHWPAFNLADSAITVGVCLLLAASLFPDSGQAKSEDAQGDAGGSRP